MAKQNEVNERVQLEVRNNTTKETMYCSLDKDSAKNFTSYYRSFKNNKYTVKTVTQ